jgi:hypothetical protein
MSMWRLALSFCDWPWAWVTAGAEAAFVSYDNGSVVIMTEGRTDGGPGALHVASLSGSLQFDAVLDPGRRVLCPRGAPVADVRVSPKWEHLI